MKKYSSQARQTFFRLDHCAVQFVSTEFHCSETLSSPPGQCPPEERVVGNYFRRFLLYEEAISIRSRQIAIRCFWLPRRFQFYRRINGAAIVFLVEYLAAGPFFPGVSILFAGRRIKLFGCAIGFEMRAIALLLFFAVFQSLVLRCCLYSEILYNICNQSCIFRTVQNRRIHCLV